MSPLEDHPLKPAVFHILLALSTQERHGLGIADEAEVASEGAVTLGPGTLYRSLDELRARGWVAQAPAPTPDADPRRKYYRLTDDGRAVLDTEIERLERLLHRARMRLAEESA